jgi:hypothetical protein
MKTPAVASVPSAPPKHHSPAVETIKHAKAEGFPVKPVGVEKKSIPNDKRSKSAI